MKPPPHADAHVDPPIEAFEHRELTGDPEVAGRNSVARLHNPWAHEQRHVDSSGFVV